ncbi:MAG: hypothetical protein QXD59_02965 [Candidatus Caldarchaeum sp.]
MKKGARATRIKKTGGKLTPAMSNARRISIGAGDVREAVVISVGMSVMSFFFIVSSSLLSLRDQL